MCRCWLGSPGMSRTKSPALLTILCAFPTGFFSRDLGFFFFNHFFLFFEVCGSCTEHAGNFHPLVPS